eukprot:TRINITY_DN49486_c0_g1_i2.p1 TRINITY_DN49486_c0_g1~~TRINITY_DN49486_c0_g1_i2.p1  ORF type:complete len:231 (-),score=22.71 TRINITY_DN49486_c0_g1_i2:69-761(-)
MQVISERTPYILGSILAYVEDDCWSDLMGSCTLHADEDAVWQGLERFTLIVMAGQRGQWNLVQRLASSMDLSTPVEVPLRGNRMAPWLSALCKAKRVTSFLAPGGLYIILTPLRTRRTRRLSTIDEIVLALREHRTWQLRLLSFLVELGMPIQEPLELVPDELGGRVRAFLQNEFDPVLRLGLLDVVDTRIRFALHRSAKHLAEHERELRQGLIELGAQAASDSGSGQST